MKFITSLRLFNLLIFVIAGVVSLNSCHTNNADGADDYLKLVKTDQAKTVPLVKKKNFAGILEEDKKMNLAFRVAGPILKYYVKEGDYVKKGQLIVEMDARDYEVQKQAVETQAKQLQSEYKRIKELNDRKSLADNDYEKMKAGKEMAEAKLKNAIDQLEDTKLYAPYSGYITKVNFDAGELVSTGTPVASIIALNQLKVEINIPASLYINKEHITKIECTQEDIPGKVFPLNLYANGKKADNSGLYTLYLSYTPTKESKLLPGMNVSVDVFINNCDSNLVSIPSNALFEKGGNSYVWIVRDSIVTSKQVIPESAFKNGNVNICSGLEEGDEVVTGGLNLLSDGEKVKVVPPASKTNIGNLL